MKLFSLITILSLASACTFSVIMNHTEGTASDVVDETQSVPTQATANVNVTPVPSL